MEDLFTRRMQLLGGSLGAKTVSSADAITDATFTNDGNYKTATLYDVNGNFLETLDCKYQKTADFSLSTDAVEHKVVFRPHYHPEKKYALSDGVKRLGFFLDLPDDDGDIERWMILSRDDRPTSTRYVILKCNYVFKWIVNGIIYEQLGIMRDLNNYNSWTHRYHSMSTARYNWKRL